MIRLLNFSFKGRSTRLEYWRVQVLSLVLFGVIGVISLLTLHWLGGYLFFGCLPLFVLSLVVSVRRLHDRGRSGWWYLLFMVGPYVCAQTANELLAFQAPMNSLLSLPFSLAALALGLWGLVEIGFLRGRPGPNRYGDDPARIAVVAETFA